LLVRLSPEQIEKQFEQGLVLQKKAKCWDRFKALHKNAQTHAIEDFYGEAFVKAYEAQLRILQSKSSHNQQ
jgi:type VI secretion system protein